METYVICRSSILAPVLSKHVSAAYATWVAQRKQEDKQEARRKARELKRKGRL